MSNQVSQAFYILYTKVTILHIKVYGIRPRLHIHNRNEIVARIRYVFLGTCKTVEIFQNTSR